MQITLVSLSFLAIVAAVAAGVVALAAAAARAAGRDPGRVAGRVAAAIAGWLAVTALATAAGIVRFDRGPARIVPLPLFAIAASIVVLRGATGRALIAAAPRVALMALHSFRVPVELVLWALYLRGELPVALTFEGANADVLAGLTAAPVALIAWGGGRRVPALAIAWHLACLALLANIVLRAIAAGPAVIGTLPFVWLPAFVVPVAAVAHVAGLWQARDALRAPAARDAQAPSASRSTR
jgi:hypothetical protein